jgi:oxygen-independent coproporphyrinogen III oxidase
MWAWHPELLETPVPRYTSYPTAAEFNEGVGAAEMQAALDVVAAETPVSLYLHIPYCREICWYCGCNTGAANRANRLSAYLEALEQEIDLVSGRLAGRGRVSRIAFGGGSPNAIAAERFVALVARVRRGFAAETASLSVELDPRTVDSSWIEALREVGVERGSLGVQTFDPAVQKAIGRVQAEESIRRSVTDLRGAGMTSLNFDLMYGLPGQSLDSLLDTLATAVTMTPDRIALFGYAHVPQLIPRQRRIDANALPGSKERFAQAAEGYRYLLERGYQPVGFDHFALPGDPLAIAARERRLRRNFQGFTDDASDVLIGLGASAISEFPDLLVQNEKNPGRYRMLVSGDCLPAARGVARDGDQQRRANVIEQLLCHGETEVSGALRLAASPKLEPFEARGLIRWSGCKLILAPDGLPYARMIASAFDAHRSGEAAGKFSHAV